MTTDSRASERRAPGRRSRLLPQLRPVLEVVLALATVAAVLGCVTRFVATPWAVAGSSMSPALKDGDRVVVDLWTYRGQAPRPGEIALLEGPGGVAVVKRVTAVPDAPVPESLLVPRAFPGEELFWVLGDNAQASLDSRDFGAVPRHCFRGRVVWRYWPWSRTGAIR